MSWGVVKDPAIKFGPTQAPGHFSGGRALEARAARPVTVGTRTHAFKGYITAVNGVVLVLEHPKGRPVTIPVAVILHVTPLPEGAKF